MPPTLRKAIPVDLRAVGLDERWLQQRITEDTSLLGLGGLEIAGREHRQPVGGRIDFLMRDPESETYYEVEVMLGALDESHIIRTIEYWDIERQRRPLADHRAVIVAEQITARFFNVLRLLNRSVPIIAIQLSAFSFDDTVVLNPVTVLDVIEEISDDAAESERTDRTYWEKKAEPNSLAIVDAIVARLRTVGIEPRITYNRHHIALGSTGYNFCWFHPRKAYCHIEYRTLPEARDTALSALQSAGVDATPQRTDRITFSTTTKGLNDNEEAILAALTAAEQTSRE